MISDFDIWHFSVFNIISINRKFGDIWYFDMISMSRKGNQFDNALAESFIKTLKSEEVHLRKYRTMEDAQRRIPYFIEDVYNHKRLHSVIGYCPPSEFEFLLKSTCIFRLMPKNH
jgi:transposase InsO family protein